ncbi:MAG TPA: MFS transporter, partial [Tichowtungia sp.]|nr:MFS transporter [Tichowtungia sp.]
GGLFFAKAGQNMLDAGQPVLAILGFIGWVVGITVIFSSLLLFVPEKTITAAASPDAHTLGTVLRQQKFRALFWQMFCGTFGGLLIIGNLKPIGLSIELTAEAATLAVMLFAVANAAGRVLWGLWYDRLGRIVLTADMLLLSAGALLMGLVQNQTAFYIATVMVAFAFGGCFVLYAARVADFFGTDRISDIYPFVFLGYGIAGLTGAPVGGWLLATSGSPLLPGLTVILIAAFGTVSIIRLNRQAD